MGQYAREEVGVELGNEIVVMLHQPHGNIAEEKMCDATVLKKSLSRFKYKN